MSIVPVLVSVLQLTVGPNVTPEAPMTSQETERMRGQIEAINAAHPVPDDATLAQSLVLAERTMAEVNGRCAPTGAADISTSSATAVPWVREHIQNGRAVNGWVVTFTPEGCGESDNVIYTVANSADDNLRAVRMGNGETLATATITQDLQTLSDQYLPRLFSLNGVECGIGSISKPTMRIASQNNMGEDFYGTRLRGSWVEEWSYEGCGHRATVPVELEWTGRTGALFQMRFDTATVEPLSDS